jgi:hypothetical protein
MRSPGANIKRSEPAIRRVVLIALLYLVASFQAMLPVNDPDIWWHLRVGEWIVENQTVPFQDYFSAYGYGKPWIAYSWLFEVLMYAVHGRFGLTGIVYFTVIMAIIITLAVHQLLRLARLPVIAEVTLTALVLAAMKPLMSPRPWLFTILFFAIELILISRAREEGKARLLWFLPLIFILWANLHIQFIYGLAILVLLLIEGLVVTGFGWYGHRIARNTFSPVLLISVTAASLVATLISPSHVWIYKPVWEYVGRTGAFQNISELHPMFFRSPEDWIVLSLTLAAVFALGWQRKWSPFPILLLLLGVFFGFRARRDIWFLVIAASTIVAEHLRHRWHGSSVALSRGQIVTVGVLVALALYSIGIQRQIDEPNLQSVVANEYPVAAVAFLRKAKLPGPLFNTLDWGGFLIWTLPELPVVIDGRTNLHGDQRLETLLGVWQGQPGWDANPELRSAGLIVADHVRPLTWLLRRDSRYRIVYEDRTAVVFVPADQELSEKVKLPRRIDEIRSRDHR